MSAFGGITVQRLNLGTRAFCWLVNVRFSNRPVRVKRFQTIYHHSVDVARGHMLLFGIGAEALPPWGSRTRWNNLLDGLAVSLTTGPSGHTNSPHPSSREGLMTRPDVTGSTPLTKTI